MLGLAGENIRTVLHVFRLSIGMEERFFFFKQIELLKMKMNMKYEKVEQAHITKIMNIMKVFKRT